MKQHHIRRKYHRGVRCRQTGLIYWYMDTYCGRTLLLDRDDEDAPMCATCARIWAREERNE